MFTLSSYLEAKLRWAAALALAKLSCDTGKFHWSTCMQQTRNFYIFPAPRSLFYPPRNFDFDYPLDDHAVKYHFLGSKEYLQSNTTTTSKFGLDWRSETQNSLRKNIDDLPLLILGSQQHCEGGINSLLLTQPRIVSKQPYLPTLSDWQTSGNGWPSTAMLHIISRR